MDPNERVMYPADLRSRELNTLRNARGEDGCVHAIVWDLGDVLPYAGRVFEPSDYDDKFRGFVETLKADGIETQDEFQGLMREIQDYFEDEESKSSWRGHNRMTINKAWNRFNGLPSKCGGLLVRGKVDYDGAPNVEEPFVDKEMRVVDISRLTGVPQDLVVTKVIESVWEMAEQGRLGVDKLVIFVDELNKYAPSGSRSSSLKATLVDISSRGRHLNLTLFGAQQFRSKVDDEVVGNAATSLYGRTGDEELTNSSYRSFSATVRDELLQLEKGRLLLRHAHYAVPVFGRFPRPSVLTGKAGTEIFGGQNVDLATEVQNVMHRLMPKPPAIQRIREDVDGVATDRAHDALDAVNAAARHGRSPVNPYETFKRNLTKKTTSRFSSDDLDFLANIERMEE